MSCKLRGHVNIMVNCDILTFAYNTRCEGREGGVVVNNLKNDHQIQKPFTEVTLIVDTSQYSMT